MQSTSMQPKIGCAAARLALALLGPAGLSVALTAGALPAQARVAGSVQIEAGAGQVLHLSGRATSVFAADPKIAEVRPASANSLFIFGVTPGHTSVAAVDSVGNSVGQYDVTVVPSGFDATRIRSSMDKTMPHSGLSVRQDENGVTLSGTAATPGDAERAMSIAGDTLGKSGLVENRMALSGSVQVNLRVRIAEMTRSLTRQLGINWQSINSLGQQAAVGISTAGLPAALSAMQSTISFQSRFSALGRPVALDTVIDALSQDQLVRLLAEPNLTTMSGEPASFLVGGEFPVPVASNNNDITVAFKQYGISLAFVPTVLSDGQISLHVRPEVSQITTQGAVSVGAGNATIQIPALLVRRADTTVELGSGQSFAIAGLLQDQATTISSGLPFLGDVPVLGALFRSSSFQHDQTELVIVVTPYIVRPVSNPTALELSTDNNGPPNDLERILLLRQIARHVPADHARIPGDAGFIVE